MAHIPVGLQLYTVRTETARDFIGTLRKVAQIGYAGVEFAGFGNLTAQELRSVLDDLNLRPCGAHIGINALEQDLQGTIEYQVAIGNPYIVIPHLGQEYRDSADAWRRTAQRLNEYGEACRKSGIRLCYHNHAFEFEQFDGQSGLDILYANSDPELLQAELDLYWVKKGGHDPAGYVAKLAGRLPLLHIKDMADDPEGSFAEFGTGTLNWNDIFPAAQLAGVHWYIVEQDVCKRPCLESIDISFRNLRIRGMA